MPKDLGSKAILTPVPKIPVELAPMHPVKIKKINTKVKNSIFHFSTLNSNYKFLFLVHWYFD